MLPLLNFFLKFIYRLQTYVSARFVASCNLLNLFGSSIAVGHVGKLLVVNFFCQQVSDVEFQFQVAAKLLGKREVDGVARHLVAVGHSCIGVVARASFASSHTDDSFSYAVVEQGNVHLEWLVLIEESGVDEVGRLSLHGSVLLFGSFLKLHLALDQGSIERPAEVAKTYEVETLADIQLYSVVVGTLGVLV